MEINSNTLLPGTLSLGDETLEIKLRLSVNDLLNAPISIIPKKGRPRKLSIEDERLLKLLIDTKVCVQDICKTLDISKSTFFRHKQFLNK